MPGSEGKSDYLRYAAIEADFPRLDPDSPASCPLDLKTLPTFRDLPYVPPGDTFRFLRTARVEERDYWLWEHNLTIVEGEPVKEQYFAVSVAAGRPIRLTWHDKLGLPPEQFALADYHRDVFDQMPPHWLVERVSIDDVPPRTVIGTSTLSDLHGEMLPGDEVWASGYNEGPLCAGYGFVLVRNGKTIDRMFALIS
jgi:hypothetical protein